MRIEFIGYAVSNIIHRKTRSFLTVLSILIGIMSIFALISFGIGIQRYVDEVAKEAGADKLFVQAKGTGSVDDTFAISKQDLNVVKKVKGVEQAVGMYMKVASLEFKGQRKYHYVMGMDPKDNDFVQESFGVDVVKGRSLKQGELGKITVGYNYQFEDKIFSRALKLGDKLMINEIPFEIVGFLTEVGNPEDDANIYMTDQAFESLFPEMKDRFTVVIAKAESTQNPEDLAEKVSEKLRKFNGQEKGKENFEVQTFADAVKTFTTVIGVINGVLILIALISVIVASVNIMNTMYTAVLERTKEIGIMKAIGARNSEIRDIFLLESGILGLSGGIIGVLFGYLVASTGGSIAKAAGFSSLQPVFPLSLILGCLAFSLFVGAISGYLPAVQASRQRPVDALRYE
ncbi:MAG: ABC transporter permease [Candidatus Woesearchaeota archaeon]|nr:ABC transporter permease [Candidatus Woesearchaeota archaeon]